MKHNYLLPLITIIVAIHLSYKLEAQESTNKSGISSTGEDTKPVQTFRTPTFNIEPTKGVFPVYWNKDYFYFVPFYLNDEDGWYLLPFAWNYHGNKAIVPLWFSNKKYSCLIPIFMHKKNTTYIPLILAKFSNNKGSKHARILAGLIKWKKSKQEKYFSLFQVYKTHNNKTKQKKGFQFLGNFFKYQRNKNKITWHILFISFHKKI